VVGADLPTSRKEDAVLKELLISFAITSFLVPLTSDARLTRFVVTQTRTFAGGMSFGNAGPYQRLDGTAYFEVAPQDPLNAVIVDLDKAPKNARGLVEFSSPFLILKPADMARGNHKFWYGINNRGNIIELSFRSFPPVGIDTNNPLTAADVGNNLFLELGYTFVDAGWENNVVLLSNQLVPNLPVARKDDGTSIVARTRTEYVDHTGFTTTLEGSASFTSYETADTNTAHSTFVVRDSETSPRLPIPPDEWAFGNCPTGRASLVPTTTDVCLFGGFQVDKVYELIYPAKNPSVQGLGYAVTRDLGSFLRYQSKDDVGNANPLVSSEDDQGEEGQVGVRRAYVSGSSSTGMYMRDWLYLGFNEDESHRKVFDAAQIFIPGTHRGLFNVEFSDPNIWSNQDHNHDFVSNSYPPQTFAVRTDPISGIRDGILKRPATDPLVFELDTANEFWNMMASLNVADGGGSAVAIPDNVRIYFLSSNSHIGSTGLFSSPPGPLGMCQYPPHNGATITAGYAPTARALVVALDEWADKGIEPPRSNYPRLESGTLVSRDGAAEAFPAIPGVSFPTVMNEFNLLDFGPEFNSQGGIQTVLPPVLGPGYKLFVPKPDHDGLDVAGVRAMEIRAPIGTNVGWNVRATGFRAPNLCGLFGSFFPFATTKAERLASGDPRASLEERYKNHEGFVDAVERAAQELEQERFLLPEDATTYVRAAEASSVLP
jgi:alpha/beta hydrolase family protein